MPRRPRLRLTPMQRDVLWLLEEAGSCELAVVANEVSHLSTWNSGSDVRFEIAGAVEGLRRIGFVELCYSSPIPGEGWVGESDCASLGAASVIELLSQENDSRWTTRPIAGVDASIDLCLTRSGYVALTS